MSLASELTERAKELIAERRYAEAVRACRRALLSQPRHVEVRLLLGEALLALERYDEVRVEMMTILRKDPAHAAAHRVLGEAYLRSRRPSQAAEALTKAVELDPADELARDLLSESVDETMPPQSLTIERWFAEEAQPTIQTEMPEFREPSTGPVVLVGLDSVKRSLDDSGELEDETAPKSAPLVEVAAQSSPSGGGEGSGAVLPSELTRPASPRAGLTSPSPPEATRQVRPRKPTITGHAASQDDPFGAPRLVLPAVPEAAGGLESDLGSDDEQPTGFAKFPSEATRVRDPVVTAARHSPAQPHVDPATSVLDAGDPLEPEATRVLEGDAPLDFDDLVLDEEDEATRGIPMPPARPEDGPVPGAPGAPSPWSTGDALTAVLPPSAVEGHGPTYEAPQGGPTYEAPQGGPTYEAPQRGPTYEAPPAPELPAYEPPPEASPLEAPAPPAFAGDAGAFAPIAEAPDAPGDPDDAVAAALTSTHIPPMSKRGPPTVHTKRGRPWWPLAALGVLLVLAGVATFFSVRAWLGARTTQELRELAAEAGDRGDRASLDAALAAIDETGGSDPRRVGLGARLLATLVLEHGDPRAAEVRSRLEGVDPESTADVLIAEAMLSLAEGDRQRALDRLSGLSADPYQRAEALGVRARARASLGRIEEALEEARQAMDERPGAPRHTVLHATLLHLQGRTEEALAELDALSGTESAAAVRAARARMLLTTDAERALAEATAVLALEEAASPYERAWAHLVAARVAAERGEVERVLEQAERAAAAPPLNDEPFGLMLIEALLHVGAHEQAEQQLSSLPTPAIDVGARALATAEIHLGAGRLEEAATELGRASEGPRQTLLSARLLEAQGQSEAARERYEQLLEAPGRIGRRARIRLASHALEAGELPRAIELLEPLRERVDEPDVAPLLARAYVRAERLDEASALLAAALTRRPGAPDLLAAKGALELSRANYREAVTLLSQAAEARPADADLQTDLGEAARRSGDAELAGAAYRAALEVRPTEPRAHAGLALLAMSEGDLDAAAAALEGAGEDAATHDVEVARLVARLERVRGTGAVGAELVAPLARRHRDAVIWASLGWLQSQAEDFGAAGQSFTRALRIDDGLPEALLGDSFLSVRRGRVASARRSAEAAARAAEARGLADALAGDLAVAEGRLAFEANRFDEATRLARQALEAAPRHSSAHLLLANIAVERRENPADHLRAAAEGDEPLAEAIGRHALRVGPTEAGCALAATYLERAPGGLDAADVRSLRQRCP